MIIRIVRMSFQPNKVNAFIDIFNRSMVKIRKSEGCAHLSLHQDLKASNVYYTISHWESPDHLEQNRKSDLFKNTWGMVKPLFDEQPVAYSLNKQTP